MFSALIWGFSASMLTVKSRSIQYHMSAFIKVLTRSKKNVIIGLLVIILLGGFFLRLIHHREMHVHNPIYDYPIIDSKEYTNNAEYIVETSWLGPSWPYFHPPLYTYFIAVLYWLFGISITIVRIIQILLDVGNTLLIFLVARRVFNVRIALISAVLYALYIPIIMFNTELLPPILSIFLLLIFFWLIGMCTGQKKLIWKHRCALCIAGVSFGLLIITLPNFLMCLPFIAVILFLSLRPMVIRHRIFYTSVFLVITMIPACLTMIRNVIYTGEKVFIAYNGGVNFYIGNNPDIYKTVAIPPGVEWEKFTMMPYEQERVENFAQASNYWYRQGFTYIKKHPIQWLWLLIKKAILFFNAHEFPRNFDLAFFSAYSSLSKFPLVRLNILLALGLSGMLMMILSRHCLKNKSELVMLGVVAVSYSFSIILFFVAARYRFPIVPILIISSAYAISHLFHNASNVRRSVFSAIAIILFGLVSFKPFGSTYPYSIPRTKTYALIGATLFDNGQAEKAFEYLQTGLKEPDDEYTYDLHHQLGLIYADNNDSERSIIHYRASLYHKPDNFAVWNDLASEYMTAGQLDSALVCYDQARRIAPCCAKIYLNLVEVYFAAQEYDMIIPVLESYFQHCPSPHPIINYTLGKFYMQIHHDWDTAIRYIERAIEYPHGFELTGDVYNNLGICYYYQNRFDEAGQVWKKGLRLDPGNESIQNNLKKLKALDTVQ